MPIEQEAIVQELLELLKHDRIRLPTLPEVALRAREIARSPEASAADIARVVSSDPAMVARILKVANSPLMRGPREIKDITTAIARLGLTCICNLITGLAIEQMFRAQSDIVDRAMRRAWQHSTEVAGIAHVLCRLYTPHLKPDQAILAGMLHEIGILPILAHAEEHKLFDDAEVMQGVIEKIHPFVGTRMLEAWRFPEELINVPRHFLRFDRGSLDDKADYADLVQVANLQSLAGSPHPYARLDWNRIPSFGRVGVDIASLAEAGFAEESQAAMGALR